MTDEPTYETLRPSQDKVKVTEALTGVRTIDLERCAVCSGIRGVGDHHVIFRSHGGTAGPVLPLCQKCHMNIHEGDWQARLIAKGEGKGGIEITDATGDVIWRLLAWPDPTSSSGDFIRILDAAHEAQQMMEAVAGALLPWEKVEAFNALKSVQEGGWRAQVRLIDEVLRYGTPGLAPGEKVEVVCQLFDIKRASAYLYKRIAEVFRETDALERTELSREFYNAAAKATDGNPEGWLDVAQERKLADRNVSPDDLKEEMVRAGAWPADPSGDLPEPKTKTAYGKCRAPKCGYVGYFDVLPVGSDGNVVKP